MKRATTIQCDREDCLRSADSVLKQCWTMSVPGCWASLANPEVEWSAVGDFVYNITITNYWIDHSYILYIFYYHMVITLFYKLLHWTLLHIITISLLHFLYSPSQLHWGDQAGSAHTVKAPAFPIPSGGEGLVYSLRWCWDQWQSIAWPPVERPVSER